MKKISTLLLAATLLGINTASAFDPKDLLNKLAGGSDTTTTASSESSSNGGILGALGGFISNAVANKNFTIDDLVGTWTYTSPAVTFESDNALQKIGGAGAATAVENKLSPYYQKLGFNKTTLTVDAEHNFTLKMGVLVLKGTVSKEDNGPLVFAFNAFNKIKLGKVNASATKSGSTLNLTFDATKMIELLTKVASVLNNKTLSAVTSLINSYDGIYIGFKLKKNS